jgi:PAS domain S-box-containing protein
MRASTASNPAFCAITGYSLEELRRLNCAAITHPDDLADMRSHLEKLLAGTIGSFALDNRYYRKNGSTIWVRNNVSLARDATGKPEYPIALCEEITARKGAEGAANLLAAIVDSTDDAIVSKNLDGVITSWNKSAERVFGYTPEEIVGKSVVALIPTDRQSEEARIIARLQKGERIEHFETVRKRKDGTLIDVSLTISPVKDPSGRIVGASKIARDITAQKRAENELRRANQDLEQFAFSASHDLQEPLRTIKIYSQLLEAEYGNETNDEAKEYFGYLRSAATRMEMLVRDLLAYTRASKFEAPAEAVDTNVTLAETLANLRGAIAESGATVTSDKLPELRVHGMHLQQLFQNLIGNAIKYRDPARPPAVHVNAQRRSDGWMFSVRDNGVGIHPQFKEKIFGLFTRLKAADSDGTGIGLAICQRIVERYHGRIWVESEPGQGSNFRFTLPL